MKIAVMGAGAMGCLFGAHLARSGHDVLLVDVDPGVVAAIAADGVRLGAEAVPVPITADPSGEAPRDAVLVFVKTYDTAAAAALAAPLVGPDTTVATLQNGVGGADVLVDAFGPERVLAGVTYQGATVLGPGHIRHHMHGETFLGDDLSRATPFAAALTAGGQPAHALDPAAPRIWKKLTNNCMGNCTAALTGMTAVQMTSDDGVLGLHRAIATEAVAVATALGHPLDLEDCIATNTSILASSGDGKASMLQDVEAGRRTEIDTLNGAIVGYADELGIPVPVNRAMVALVVGWERARGLRPRGGILRAMSPEERALAAPRAERTVVPLGDTGVGGGHFAVFAGPTRATDPDASLEIGQAFAGAGVALLHNGTTSQDDPHDRPSRSEISILSRLRERTGLPVAAPITDIADVEAVGDSADVVQLAGYHMQNYRLLKELGQLDRPVILRRGTANTVDELVSAAEYVLVEGNPNVILCEHGIRTFERLYELTVDFAAVPLLKERTHLPIVVDPTAAGRPNVVAALALAAAAVGADGIILEAEPKDLAAYLDVVARATACAAVLQR